MSIDVRSWQPMIEALFKRLCIITLDRTDLDTFELELNIPRTIGILRDGRTGRYAPPVVHSSATLFHSWPLKVSFFLDQSGKEEGKNGVGNQDPVVQKPIKLILD